MSTEAFDQRVIEFKKYIDEKAAGYRKRQIQQYEIEILKRLPEKIGKAIPASNGEYWMSQFEVIAKKLPGSTENGTPYVKAKNNLLRELNKKYKLQRKGQWTTIMMPVFMSAIGIPIGMSTENLGLWLPMGMVIGIVIGISIDKSAEKKGLVL
ncbi:hypothetical protein MM236_00315 [Belliella sp. DSM 107340]|uniref:Uncharacterized protein n=1 Tax=Belliella calami TaxID=2923436 RepID=A0ABS9UIH2_9BACT|nr:hypothetical protein [Belliella calami]MCH7396404.1 hypothetical protein [Belliella calami]